MSEKNTIEFKFRLDEVVNVIPTGERGVITMLAVDDGGCKAYVQSKDGQWWPERMLETTNAFVTMDECPTPG